MSKKMLVRWLERSWCDEYMRIYTIKFVSYVGKYFVVAVAAIAIIRRWDILPWIGALYKPGNGLY